VAVRQHAIELAEQAPAGDGRTALAVTVDRHVFLGASRDYMVRLADGSELRITAPASQRWQPGAKLWALLAPEQCRALRK
jgi:hypothetical protein